MLTRSSVMLLVGSLLAVVGTVASSAAWGQSAQEAADLLRRLASPRLAERMIAVSNVARVPIGSLRAAGFGPVLVDLLDRETREAHARPADYPKATIDGEGFAEYYAAILGLAAKLGNIRDDRTLRVLARSIYNDDSPFAAGLADSGGSRIIPVAWELARSVDGASRRNGLALLGRVYANRVRHGITAREASDILRFVEESASDAYVGDLAIDILGAVGSRAEIPLLEHIAQTSIRSRQTDRGLVYPLREKARIAIALIRQREQD